MTSAFETVKLILSIIPAIITAMRSIEEAIPVANAGKDKMAALRQIIEAAYGQSLTLWPIIETAIGILVKLFNKTGTFTTTIK